MPPKKSKTTQTVENQGKTSLESFLFRIRDICRDKGVQMDENGNFYADLIYDDLLFLKSLWQFNNQGDLAIDVQRIVDGTSIKDIKLDSIASLNTKDPAHMVRVFNRLWTELQRSSLKSIFEREFALTSILKDDKLKSNYSSLLADLLNYTGKVVLDEHECTDPYEYFSKDHKKAKSKYFGQFYTPMNLAEVCVAEIKPKFGEVGADVAAGTGKFMRAAANYIHSQEPFHSAADAYNHMRMTEIEPRMYRQGIYAAFLSFHRIPDMVNQQRKGNSFELLIREKEQFDYVLANPPFGGTVLGFEEAYYDTIQVEKGKRLVSKQVPKSDILYPFEFVKKDTCVLFLQLIVNKLKEGGRAAVIFNGTLMTEQHRDLIKWFLEKCNLYKMIVCPSGTFKNTGIETYCFIFKKGTPTEKIEYYELDTNKKLGEFTKEQIVERNWDINPKFQEKSIVHNTFGYVAISNLFDMEVCPIQASEAVPGEYHFITLQDNASHNTFAYDGEQLFISKIPSGTGNTFTPKIRYSNGKVNASSLMIRLIKKNESIALRYFYHYWNTNKNELKELYHGTANKSLNKKLFLEFHIPLPPLAIQQEIVASLDRILANPQDSKDCLAFTSNAMDLMLKDPTGKLLEDIVNGLRLKRAHLVAADSIKAQMAAVVKSVSFRGYEKKKLGDICSFMNGYAFKSEEFGDSGVPVVNITTIKNGEITFEKAHYVQQNEKLNKFIIKNGDFVIALSGATVGVMGINLSGKNAYLNQRVARIDITSELIYSPKYIFLIMMHGNIIEEVRSNAMGSAQPNISTKKIEELEIPIPPLVVQEEVLTILNEMEAERKTLEQMAAKAEERAKFILNNYLTPVSSNDAYENENGELVFDAV